MRRSYKISTVIAVIVLCVAVALTIHVSQHQTHLLKAKECKQKVMDCLINNGRQLHVACEIDYLKYYDIHDMSYSWLLWYILTENKTVFYDEGYRFWVTSNETMFLFDVWQYTQ